MDTDDGQRVLGLNVEPIITSITVKIRTIV